MRLSLSAPQSVKPSTYGSQALAETQVGSEPPPPAGAAPEKQPAAKPDDPGPSAADQWQAAMKSFARFALSLPLVAFVVTLFPGDPTLKASLGPLSYQPVAGLCDLAAVTLAILLVKLTRDAYRLAAFYDTADIAVELSEKITAESNIVAGYVRPVDLLLRNHRSNGRTVRLARLLDQMRTWIISVVFGVTAVATLAVLLSSIGNIAATVALPLWLARSLAVFTSGLVLIAAFDLAGVASIAVRTHRRRRFRDAEAQQVLRQLDEEWSSLKRQPARPVIWPPGNDELNAFRHDVERQKLIEWCENKWESMRRSDTPRLPWPPALETDLSQSAADVKELLAIEEDIKFAVDHDIDAQQEYNALRKQVLYKRTQTRIEELGTFSSHFDLTDPTYAKRIREKSRYGDDDGLDHSFASYKALFTEIHLVLDKLEHLKAKADWCMSEAVGSEQMDPPGWHILSENEIDLVTRKILLRHWKTDREIWSNTAQAWHRVSFQHRSPIDRVLAVHNAAVTAYRLYPLVTAFRKLPDVLSEQEMDAHYLA